MESTLLTLEQFEQLPEDDLYHELDEGNLISSEPTPLLHGKVHATTGSLLLGYVEPRQLGLVLGRAGFVLSTATLRAPDIAFLKAERTRNLDLERRFVGAPDLAIEIISPSDTAGDIAHKVGQYLRAGAMVWLVYPKDRAVHVFETSNSARILEAGDVLEAPALLPGFSVRVSEFFA